MLDKLQEELDKILRDMIRKGTGRLSNKDIPV